MHKIIRIAKEWNALKNDEERWEYLLSHKTEIGLRLDNDSTLAEFHSSVIPDEIEDIDDLPQLKTFSEWIGNSPGLDDLLPLLGIEAEGA